MKITRRNPKDPVFDDELNCAPRKAAHFGNSSWYGSDVPDPETWQEEKTASGI